MSQLQDSKSTISAAAAVPVAPFLSLGTSRREGGKVGVHGGSEAFKRKEIRRASGPWRVGEPASSLQFPDPGFGVSSLQFLVSGFGVLNFS